MKKLFLMWLVIGLASCTNNKDEKAPVKEDVYFVSVDETPMPVGGIQALMKNVVYPKEAKESGIQGRVFVKAFIDENGDVVKTELIKGTETTLDSAAENAVKRTKFLPGKQKGKPVKVQVAIPILFKLQ
jgi:protein TonB